MLILKPQTISMKKLFAIAAIVIALSACSNDKAQEKALLDDVIKLHDIVMGKDEQLMKNKMKIDTMLITIKDTVAQQPLKKISTNLVTAEEAMETWMQNFDPEQKGKTHDQIVAYLNGQKKQVTAIDSQINVAISQATQYLNQLPK
jgi:hypothetical protein